MPLVGSCSAATPSSRTTPDRQVGAHHGLAEGYRALGDTDRAVRAWRTALDLLDALGLEAIEEVTAAGIRASLKLAGR